MRTFIEVKNHQTQMPNQISARTTDGEWVYVRARWGRLTFSIGSVEDESYEEEFVIYEEESPELGYESNEEFDARFRRIIKEQKLGVIVN